MTCASSRMAILTPFIIQLDSLHLDPQSKADQSYPCENQKQNACYHHYTRKDLQSPKAAVLLTEDCTGDRTACKRRDADTREEDPLPHTDLRDVRGDLA